jgi:hypothetical protein
LSALETSKRLVNDIARVTVIPSEGKRRAMDSSAPNL